MSFDRLNVVMWVFASIGIIAGLVGGIVLWVKFGYKEQ